MDTKMSSLANDKIKKKIAILLYEPYSEEIVEYTVRFLRCMKMGMSEVKDNIEIIFGYVKSDALIESDYVEVIKEMGISIRSFKFDIVNQEFVKLALGHAFINSEECAEDKYCIANDGVNYFEDCDALILMNDKVPERFFSTKPIILVVHDYFQRYIPELLSSEVGTKILAFQRNVSAVFVNSVPIYDDAIQYAGIKKEKIKLCTELFEFPIEKGSDIFNNDYFIWQTNVMPYHRHFNILKGLSMYYKAGGNAKCIIIGPDTELFKTESSLENLDDDMKKHVIKIRNYISGDAYLKENISFWGNVSKCSFINLLQNAVCLFQPSVINKGIYSIFYAAFYKVPSLCSKVPEIEYFEKLMNLNIQFVDAYNCKELGQQLGYIDKNRKEIVAGIPLKEELIPYTIQCTYKELYGITKEVLGL